MHPTQHPMPSAVSKDPAHRGHGVKNGWVRLSVCSFLPAAGSLGPVGQGMCRPFSPAFQKNVLAAPLPPHPASWVYFTRSARISLPPLLSLLPALPVY